MIELLRELVELESPTGDTAAMRDRMADELRVLGGRVFFDGEHVRADFPGDGAPLVLLGHLDTVWRATFASDGTFTGGLLSGNGRTRCAFDGVLAGGGLEGRYDCARNDGATSAGSFQVGP